MAKKYCRKSSIKAVADEIRVREGSSSTDKVQGSMMYYRIQNLELPVNYGSPNTVLTANNQSHTVLMGKYTGGSVSVTPQNATATLSQNGGYVPIEDGKTLASVKVPAKNAYSYSAGKITPASGATSISISGLSFTPLCIVVVNTSKPSTLRENQIAVVYCDKSGTVRGVFPNKSAYVGSVTSASASFGSNSVSISNVVGVRNGTTINGAFANVEYSWFAWG